MALNEDRPQLSHIAPTGEVRMVDIGGKDVTSREAVASARIQADKRILDAMMTGDLPKGDALATARIAGIQAAKRTAEWIPLCHTIPITFISVDFDRISEDTLCVTCTAKAHATTGVEMEALVGASATALTLYDMAKAVSKSIIIGPIQLERKSGGKGGDFVRSAARS